MWVFCWLFWALYALPVIFGGDGPTEIKELVEQQQLLTQSRSAFRNALHVYQTFAQQLWPKETEKQLQFIVVCQYLFRQAHWVDDYRHWTPLYVFFRTGGLDHDFNTREVVTLAEVSNHNHRFHIEMPLVYHKPSIEKLVQRLHKSAEKKFGLNKDLLKPPPFLGNRGANRGNPVSEFFKGAPKPMTMTEAERLLGDRWKAASSSRGQQLNLKDLQSTFEPGGSSTS